MFREMVRKKQAMSTEECLELLRREPRGVLSVLGDDGYPYGMPINFWYCDADGRIYIHGGQAGHKIDALRRCDKVSLCVYDQGVRKEGDWALSFRSVIVFGRVEFLADHEHAMEVSRQLSYKFTRDEEYIAREIQTSGPRTLCFAIIPDHISGKRVHEA